MSFPIRLQLPTSDPTGLVAVATVAAYRDLLTLQAGGRLPETETNMRDALQVWQTKGKTFCHFIALGLLVDMTNAGCQGLQLHQGEYYGRGEHSWIEWNAMALDGSIIERDAPVLLVAPRSWYRTWAKVSIQKTFTAEDVRSGRYLRESLGNDDER